MSAVQPSCPPCPTVCTDKSVQQQLFQASGVSGVSGANLLQSLIPAARCANEYGQPQQPALMVMQAQQQQQQAPRPTVHPLNGAMMVGAPITPAAQQYQAAMNVAKQQQQFAAPVVQQQQQIAAPVQQQQQQQSNATVPTNMLAAALTGPPPTLEDRLRAAGKPIHKREFTVPWNYSHNSMAQAPSERTQSLVGKDVSAVDALANGDANAKLLITKVELIRMGNKKGLVDIGLNIAGLPGKIEAPNGKKFLHVTPAGETDYHIGAPLVLYEAKPDLAADKVQRFAGQTTEAIMSVAESIGTTNKKRVPLNSTLAHVLFEYQQFLGLDLASALRLDDAWIIPEAAIAVVKESLDKKVYDKLQYWKPEDLNKISIDRADGYEFGDHRGVSTYSGEKLATREMTNGCAAGTHVRITYAVV